MIRGAGSTEAAAPHPNDGDFCDAMVS